MAKDLSFSITNLLNLKGERDQKCNDSGFAEETITQTLTPNTPPSPNTHTERDSRSCGLTLSAKTYSGRTRARRTKWSPQLLEKMHVMFDTVDRKPSHRQIMEDLAGGDELLAGKIQIWFQNKRAAVKKQKKIIHTDDSGTPSSTCRASDLSPTSSHPTTATPDSSSQFTIATISSSPASKNPTSISSKFRHTTTTAAKRATRHGDVIQIVMSECPVITSTPTRERTPTRGSVAVDTEASSSSYNTPMTISERPAKRRKAARGPYADGDSSKTENPTVKSESRTRPFDFHSRPGEILSSHSLGFNATPNFRNQHFNTIPPTFPNHYFDISPAFPNHHLNNSSTFHNYHFSGSVGISPVTPHLGISGFSPLVFASSPVEKTSAGVASRQSSARMNPSGLTIGSLQETHRGSYSEMESREANQSCSSMDSIRLNPADVRATSLGSNVYFSGPPCSPETFHHGYIFSSPAAAVTSYTSRSSSSDQWTDSGVTIPVDVSPAAGQPGSAFRPFQRSANLLDR